MERVFARAHPMRNTNHYPLSTSNTARAPKRTHVQCKHEMKLQLISCRYWLPSKNALSTIRTAMSRLERDVTVDLITTDGLCLNCDSNQFHCTHSHFARPDRLTRAVFRWKWNFSTVSLFETTNVNGLVWRRDDVFVRNEIVFSFQKANRIQHAERVALWQLFFFFISITMFRLRKRRSWWNRSSQLFVCHPVRPLKKIFAHMWPSRKGKAEKTHLKFEWNFVEAYRPTLGKQATKYKAMALRRHLT